MGQKPIHHFIRTPLWGQDLKKMQGQDKKKIPAVEWHDCSIIAEAEMTHFSFLTTFQTLTTCWESYYFRESCTQDLILRLITRCFCEHRLCWVLSVGRRKGRSKDNRQPLHMALRPPNRKTKPTTAHVHPGLRCPTWHFCQFGVLRKL